MADAFPLLRRMHLFISLTDDELRELASHFEPVEFKAEEVVFNQGDQGDAFYAIQDGEVEVTRADFVKGPRLLSRLVAGDYFGEMALHARRPRSATIKALTALKLWKLSRDDYYRSIFNNQDIKPHLEVAIRSRNFARNEDFLELLRGDKSKEKTDEIVYLATLQHPIFLWEMLIPSFVALLLVLALAAGVFYARTLIPPAFLPWAWGVVAFLFVVDLAWIGWNWVDFHNDWYIVTNKRIIDIDKVVFLFDSRAEVPINAVSSTETKSSQAGQIFHYGDLIVNTFGGPVIFHNIPHPQATADMILEYRNRARVQKKLGDRNKIKDEIRKSLQRPEPEALFKAKPAVKKPPTLRERITKFRQQFSLSTYDTDPKSKTITYHKHHFVLIQHIGLQLLGVVGVIFILFLYTFHVFTFDPILTLIVSLILFVIFIGSALYQFLDWRNDIYQITENKIIDLERKPLGLEQRKEANLGAVMNVSYTRPGIVATFLNYGTVIVQAGPGGEMKFHHVSNPLGVQQDIYRRKEALEAKAEAEKAKQIKTEVLEHIAAFNEVLEEDRQKRTQEGKL
ncbi:MAG: cyclic nucleotide-binding domain-containing protein [Chloroflexota bacterium]